MKGKKGPGGGLWRLSYREGKSSDGGLWVREEACIVEAMRGKGVRIVVEEEEDGYKGDRKPKTIGGRLLSF